MTREGTISHANAEETEDLILRVTALVREIDALKRERTTELTRHVRAELGAIYFRKRMERQKARTSARGR